MAEPLDYQAPHRAPNVFARFPRAFFAALVACGWIGMNIWPPVANSFFVPDNDKIYGFPFLFQSSGGYVYEWSFSAAALAADLVSGAAACFAALSIIRALASLGGTVEDAADTDKGPN